MNYTIKAHPTRYQGVQFRSRLEARWAAFFDLMEWEWEYEAIDLNGWSPDFVLHLPCSCPEFENYHRLFVEIKPYFSIKDFDGHPCTWYPFGYDVDEKIPADASAGFGISPKISQWEMVHGDGGGVYSLPVWINAGIDIDYLWKQAGNITQYHP